MKPLTAKRGINTHRLSEEWMADTQSLCNRDSPGSGAN